MSNQTIHVPKKDAPKPESRPKRVPVSEARDILTVGDKDPNYEYRWVNDVENRLQIFKQAGWEIVTKPHEVGMNAVDKPTQLGSAVTRYAGGGITAVLHRIPKEWYDEDQAAKQDRLDELEAAMRQKQEGQYGSVDVKTTRGGRRG